MIDLSKAAEHEITLVLSVTLFKTYDEFEEACLNALEKQEIKETIENANWWGEAYQVYYVKIGRFSIEFRQDWFWIGESDSITNSKGENMKIYLHDDANLVEPEDILHYAKVYILSIWNQQTSSSS